MSDELKAAFLRAPPTAAQCREVDARVAVREYLRSLFPPVRIFDAAAERAVLGAIITGALRARDIRDVDAVWFDSEVAGSLFTFLRSAWSLKTDAIVAAWTPALRSPWSAGPAWKRAYVLDAARAAPKRTEALYAIGALRKTAERREEERRIVERARVTFGHWQKEAARFAVESERERMIVDLVGE